jgi:hypothetical protein
MFTKLLSKLSPAQRDSLFTRIRCLVLEIDATDRSLEGIGEGLAIDEVLDEIAGELDAELVLARTRRSEVLDADLELIERAA